MPNNIADYLLLHDGAVRSRNSDGDNFRCVSSSWLLSWRILYPAEIRILALQSSSAPDHIFLGRHIVPGASLGQCDQSALNASDNARLQPQTPATRIGGRHIISRKGAAVWPTYPVYSLPHLHAEKPARSSGRKRPSSDPAWE